MSRDLIYKLIDANADVFPGIASWLDELDDNSWSLSQLQATLEKSTYSLRVAEGVIKDVIENVSDIESPIYGFCLCNWVADSCSLLYIAVQKKYRHAGIAQSLLQDLIKMANLKRCDEIQLEVRESNIRAIELYIRNGFNLVGRREAYYPALNKSDASMHSSREPALLFSLSLSEVC